MNTIAEILDWFASHGMAGSERLEYRSGQRAAFVGRRSTLEETAVLENAVFVFPTAPGRWRVDRYFFGGRREGVDLENAEAATQVALAVIETGEWPKSVAAREF
jgi:hypothetical protein